MKTALLPGSFDPPTLGHINIIERVAAIFDSLIVLVSNNKEKKYLFSLDERKEMVSDSVRHLKNVSVAHYNGLTVDYALKHGVSVIVRGVRPFGDFSYEMELAVANKVIAPNIDTLFIPTDPEYIVMRSSQIKELAAFGAPISSMVTKDVEKKVIEKIGEIKKGES